MKANVVVGRIQELAVVALELVPVEVKNEKGMMKVSEVNEPEA